MPNPWAVYNPKKYRLFDIFAVWYEAEVSSLGVTVDGEEIFTNAQVFGEMTEKYSGWYWQTVAPDFGIQFLDLWHGFVANTGDQLLRAYKALQEEYNPVENYSMIENGVDGVKRDTDTTTNTPEGSTTTERDVNRFGLNSTGDGSPSDKETTTTSFTDRTDTETRTHDNTVTSTFEGSTLGGYNEAHEHNFKRTGNIGTMTASDMLAGEMRIRMGLLDLLKEYVQAFMAEYCYYVGCEYYEDNTI